MYKGSKYVRPKQQSNSFEERVETIKQGGAPKYHEQNKAKGKLFVRDRLALLFDNGEYVEDALFANCEQTGLPADGVVTATGKIHGRTACVMANDSTVKLDHGDHAQLKRFYVFKKQLKNYVFRYFI